jgi:ribose transport system permease protein
MNAVRTRLFLWLLNKASVVLFAGVLAIFGLLAPRFLQPENLANILIQSSSTAIVAIGMTFVLLTAGVDLSVGSIMFVSASVAGKMILGGSPLWLALMAILFMGLAGGALNAFFIVRLRIAPFIVTLSTLYIGRGFGLWITETRAMNLPGSVLRIGSDRVLGVPVPILVLAGVLALAHLILTRTPFGRQVYAVGRDVDAARKAGVGAGRVLGLVYVIGGLCAAVGGILSLAQLGAVSPTFGVNKEFAAIAAAVLGGTSLFGGRGSVFPGTVIGAVLIQSIENGLVILNADPYLYPLVTSAVIFLAVLTDSLRSALLAKLGQRKIRIDPIKPSGPRSDRPG